MYLKTPIRITMPVILGDPLAEPALDMPPATPTYRYMQADHERDWEDTRYAMESAFYRLLSEEHEKLKKAEAKIEELTAQVEVERRRYYNMGMRAGYSMDYLRSEIWLRG